MIAAITPACKKSFTDPVDGSLLDQEKLSNNVSLLTDPEFLTDVYNLPSRLDSNFIWGINGHSLNQVAYEGNYALQVDLQKELTVTHYRIDIPNDMNGEINSVGLSRFNALLTQSSLANIQLLPVLWIPDTTTMDTYSHTQADANGYILGKGFASRYKQHFNCYQLGNEEDNKLLDQVNQVSGIEPGHYNAVRFPILAQYFKGMIRGIREEDPTAKIIINNGGWYHYGYFALLNQANVDYDIIGYDWYDEIIDFQTILSVLQTNFASKDVWFTEVNSRDPLVLNAPTNHRDRIDNLIAKLDQKTNVKAFFIYELFDEDNQPGIERQFGMIDWVTDNVYTNFTYKEAFKMYKFKIEETKHGFQDFVHSLYLFGNHRAPDPGGLAYWTNRVATYRNIPALINEFLGIEFYAAFVEEQYQLLYGHAADPTGKDYWTNRLMTDLSREELVTIFCSETEFWTLSGATNSGFINRVFQKLLNRNPYPAEVTDWTQRLTTGTTKITLVAELLHSPDYLALFVQAQFNFLLRRNGSVDSQSISWGVGLMQNGMTQRGFIKTLMNGKEFYQRAIQEGYVRNNPPYQF